MNKQIPSINKIVQFHNFKRTMQLHQSKIRNVKPTLTTRTDKVLKLNINLNKTAKQPFGNSFSRMIDIELENKALLKKLTQKNLKPHQQQSTSPQQNTHHPQQSWQQPSYLKHITNNRKKYFEQHQRRIQNEGLLRRLKQVKPLYQMKKYMSERKMTEKYINSISKFGYKDYKPNKTILKFDMDALREESQAMVDSSRQEEKQALWQGSQWKTRREGECGKENQRVEGAMLKKSRGQTLRQQKVKTQLKKSKVKMFTQRNPNTHHPTNPANQPLTPHRSSQLLQNNSSQFRSTQRSQQNSPTKMQSSFISHIPQRQIKLNGRHFLIKGKQTFTKIKLEILELKRDKTIGNEYIHEVEIANSVYVKKFGGRVDVIIDHLKFDSKAQVFFIQ